MEKDQRMYATDNLGIAAFLALNGLSHVGTELHPGKYGKKRAFFIFDDEAGLGPSLEKEFVRSKEKLYKDYLTHFRTVASKTMDGEKILVSRRF